MSKRGGTSEVNGFISIGADGKSVKKKDGSVAKNESSETPRKRPEAKKEPTQSRARLSNEASKKEPPQKHPVEKKELRTKAGEGTSNRLHRKESIKKEPPLLTPSRKTDKAHVASDKHKILSKELQKSYSETSTKAKEAASSYLSKYFGRQKKFYPQKFHQHVRGGMGAITPMENTDAVLVGAIVLGN